MDAIFEYALLERNSKAALPKSLNFHNMMIELYATARKKRE